MTYAVFTTKSWNMEAFAKIRGHDPDWHLFTSKAALNLETLDALKPRYIFFPHWSWKVPKEITDKYECVCFHTAPLPEYRGGSVIQHQIADGKTDSLITVLRMTDEIDAGPIYTRTPISLDGPLWRIFQEFAVKSHRMMEFMVVHNPEPYEQEGEPTVYKRRTPNQSLLPAGDLEHLYDHIRMLDCPEYPRAFFERGGRRFEFKDAALEADALVAMVRIT